MRSRRLLLVLVASSFVSIASLGCKKDEAKSESPATSASVHSAAKEEPKGTTFAKKPPTVGAKREETETMSMDMSLNVDPGNGKAQKSDMAMDESMKRTEEILAVEGDAITKLKVKFDNVEMKMKEGGKDNAKPSPLSGKTYIVESKGGKTEIRDEKGKFVPAIETKEIEKRYHTLGKPDPMLAAIPTTPLKPGDKVESLAKALTDQIKEQGDDMAISDVVVTFKEAKGDDGIFDVAMKLAKNEGPMSMKMDMVGEAAVSTKTGWPTKTELKGPITIGSKPDAKSPLKMDGSGKMSMKMESKGL